MPGCIVLDKTKVDKLRLKIGKGALKYEEKMWKLEDQRLVKECLKEKILIGRETRSGIERLNHLHRNGVSQEGMESLRDEIGKEETHKVLMERDRYIQL